MSVAVSAAVLVVLVFVLILVVILVLVVILILVLVLHDRFLHIIDGGIAAKLSFPKIQALSLALKIKLESSPAKIAAAMPPAQAFSPPVKIPRNPLSSTASLTPLARL